MLKTEAIAELGQQLLKFVPEAAFKTQKDIETNIQALLQSTFAKLELVSREEFAAQSAVLHRTREKLHRIESELADLERKLDNSP